MREQLIEICRNRLAITDNCIEHFEAHKQAAELDMFSPIPATSEECTSIGNILKELGVAIKDFELIGIGQTFVDKSELLLLEESKAKN